MRCGSWIGIAVVVAGAAVFGCDKVVEDKADTDYQTCTQRKTNGFLEAAVEACKSAVAKDASSKSGKAAAQLLLKLEPVVAQQQAEVAAAQQKGAQAAQAARVARLASLKAKIQRKYSSSSPDAYCTGKGLPPYLWDYTGGTFTEDAELATSEGCASLFPGDPSNISFCCSRKPGIP